MRWNTTPLDDEPVRPELVELVVFGNEDHEFRGLLDPLALIRLQLDKLLTPCEFEKIAFTGR